MTESAVPTLTTDQLTEVLGLLASADSVELKLTVPDSDRRSTVTALELDPMEAQLRQVTFFDTPDLALSRHGVVVRARRVQGKAGDAVVKLRPLVPDELPSEVRESGSFGVEVDAAPGGFVCSGSMKSSARDDLVKDVVRGRSPLRKLLTAEQRTFFTAHAPEGLGLDDLRVLGPITVLKLKFRPSGFARRMVAELWLYPDGSRILELSTKCETGEAFQVAAELKAFLAGHGVDLGAPQQMKTGTALAFFAEELRSPGQ
jgi:hypothetical protein